MLTSLVRPIAKDEQAEPEAEDIFTSALGLVFTDDSQNFFGDVDHLVAYKSRKLDEELLVQTADVNGETERRKFAHYVWTSGILMAELVGGKPGGIVWRIDDLAQAKAQSQITWWLSEAEQSLWTVEGRNVLELGAGVGLGGISSAFAGAAHTSISDYPAPAILETIKQNVIKNVPTSLQPSITVEGHVWGNTTSRFSQDNANAFDHILAADCLWMPHEHGNLALSMSHFLSIDASARVYVIAGFHTGRANVAAFFREALPQSDLAVDYIWEIDVDGNRRAWDWDAADEDSGTRKRWLVVAVLKRTTTDVSVVATSQSP